MDIYLIRTSLLKDFCNPFVSDCWLDVQKPITYEEVKSAIKDQKFLAGKDVPEKSFSQLYGEINFEARREEHLSRIAYLVVNKDNSPIDIDVGIPSLGLNIGWKIIDGNHRFAAALFRDDTTIETTFSGSIKYFNELFSPLSMRKVEDF